MIRRECRGRNAVYRAKLAGDPEHSWTLACRSFGLSEKPCRGSREQRKLRRKRGSPQHSHVSPEHLRGLRRKMGRKLRRKVRRKLCRKLSLLAAPAMQTMAQTAGKLCRKLSRMLGMMRRECRGRSAAAKLAG